MMSFSFLESLLERLSLRWPLLMYAATWTTILTILVAIASFLPELAFVSAISPTSSFSEPCHNGAGRLVRLPLDVPGEAFCFPAQLFRRSKMDLLIPPFLSAVIVAASAYLVKSLGLWEADYYDHELPDY